MNSGAQTVSMRPQPPITSFPPQTSLKLAQSQKRTLEIEEDSLRILTHSSATSILEEHPNLAENGVKLTKFGLQVVF